MTTLSRRRFLHFLPAVAAAPLAQWPYSPAPTEPVGQEKYVSVDLYVASERWQNHRLDWLERQFLRPGPYPEGSRTT